MNKNLETEENNLSKIILIYDNGKTKEITKGMVLTLDEKNREAHMNMEFASMSGKDLIDITYGFLQFASESGMISKLMKKEK